ncbi:hypothetical protein [Vibrio sp. WXL210]|uniref:hypothetical protein n=1 Tax=Vibrio sp. WXL210 TaxID=3450709 RepID=UPI003EC94CE8
MKISRTDTVSLICLIVLLVLVGFGVYQVMAKNNSMKTDIDLCLVEGGPARNSILLVDQTDDFGFQHKVDNFVQSLIMTNDAYQVQHNEKLGLVGISNDPTTALQFNFIKCNPGTGSDFNSLYTTGSVKDEINVQEFRQPLTTEILAMLSEESMQGSKIVETIQKVSESEMFRHQDRPRRLMIVSDMLQNSPGEYSQNAHVFRKDFEAEWKRFYSHYQYVIEETDLSNVQVYIWLQRPVERRPVDVKNMSSVIHKKLWRRYFAEVGTDQVVFVDGRL